MNSRKRLLRTVNLRLFQDDSGNFGVTHEDTIQQHDDSFDAFWDGRGIFHDVFEHAHEMTDKHFRGLAAMNIGGEVAAMGQMWFYINRACISNRMFHSHYSDLENAIVSTSDMMREQIEESNGRFGSELISSVPRQKETDSHDLENLISEHFSRIESLIPGNGDSGSEDSGKIYKESVTLEKLQNLYRYGWRMGEKLMGENPSDSSYILEEFINFWNGFCKGHDAEMMSNYFRKIVFKLYRDTEGLLHWVAEICPHIGDSEMKTVKVKGGPNGVITFNEEFLLC